MSQSKSGFSLKQQLGRGKQIAGMTTTIAGGMRAAQRIGAFKQPPRETLPRYIQVFCRKMAGSFGVKVIAVERVEQLHGLWVSNHVSWMDIPVVGTVSPAFFLSKAEIGDWPIFGKLAKGGGTLFIQRGSGDSIRIKEQITDFLKQDIPVLFFPEATTTDGTKVKKVHGRLLGAAIDAQRPVQICLICYVNNHGELDNVAPYIGNISFTEHVTRVLKMPKVIAHLKALPQIDVTGHSVESLTHEVQEKMQQGLQQLQQQVLKQMPKNS